MYMYYDQEQEIMGGMINYAAKKWKDNVAIHWKDQKITFAQLDKMSCDFAKGLHARGIQQGDRIGLWMHNHPEWVVAWFGISKIGAVVVPLDYWYKPKEAEYILHHSGARGLVISGSMLGVDFPGMISDIRRNLPGLYLTIIKGEKTEGWMTEWEELIESGSHLTREEMEVHTKEIDENDTDFILYTSGTTGKPKGACLSHYNVLRNAWDVGAKLRTVEEDNVLVPVPYSHCFGNTLALTMAVLRGAAQTPMLEYSPERALQMIDQYGCTMHHGVPTMFIRELHAFRDGDYSLKTLRTGIMAGAPCPYETVKAVLDEMKCKVLIAYGQTEASPVITMTSFWDTPEIMASTVGKMLPGMDVKIVDPETGRELPLGEQGELCAKGYNVMKGGYFKQPDLTSGVIIDGWLHTGDLAEVDEFGYFKITGRAKDMVIVGGFNVFPRIIEEHIITHPKVKEVAATAVKDEDLGEVVGVAVVPGDGEDVEPLEIVDFCYDEMASAAVPRYVAVVEELPITGRGKVQKFKLKERLDDMAEHGELKKIVPTAVKKKK